MGRYCDVLSNTRDSLFDVGTRNKEKTWSQFYSSASNQDNTWSQFYVGVRHQDNTLSQSIFRLLSTRRRFPCQRHVWLGISGRETTATFKCCTCSEPLAFDDFDDHNHSLSLRPSSICVLSFTATGPVLRSLCTTKKDRVLILHSQPHH